MSSEGDLAITTLGAAAFQTWPCALVLDFPGVATATCTWQDYSTVVITLSSAFPLVGTRLYLQPYRLKARCPAGRDCANYETSPEGSVLLQGPANPVSPSIKFVSASSVNRCGDIQIDTSDSTGRGGAPWGLLAWTVSSSTGNAVLHIQNLLDAKYSQDTGMVRIKNSMLRNGTYEFSLSATNMFGLQADRSLSVTVSSDDSTPTIYLSGPGTMFRADELNVIGFATIPLCDGGVTTAGLTYSWSVYIDETVQPGLQSVARNVKNFRLPAFSLDPYTNYSVRLTVRTSTGHSSFVTHVVEVLRAKCKAFINGGSYLTTYERSSRILDGSESYDMDYPFDKTLLHYRWTCIENSPNFGAPCPESPIPEVASIPFKGTDHVPLTEYLFTLFVRNPAVPDSEDSTSTIMFVKPGLPVPVISFQGLKSKYNRDERLILLGVINTEYTSSESLWTAVDQLDQNVDLSGLALTDLRKTLSYGTTYLGLTVAKNTLTAGVAYTFTVTATYFPEESAEAAEAYGKCVVLINAAPSSGRLVVTDGDGVDSGTALSTLFQFDTSLWSDASEDFPLSYQFTSYVADPAQSNMIRAYQQVSSTTGFLGQGQPENDYVVTCVAWARDIWGAEGTATDVVKVLPPTSGATAVSNAQTLLASQSGNPEIVKQILNALVATFSAVDCSKAPDCGSLNRQECEASPNVCGLCMPGYPFGDPEEANTPCSASGQVQSVASSSSVGGDAVAAVITSKSCPNDCSAHGQCVYLDWFGSDISTCSTADPLCRAACDCTPGFLGRDCSMSLSEFNTAVHAKQLVCSSLYNTRTDEDMSRALMISRATTVSTLFRDMTAVSNEAYVNCSLFLLETISGNLDIAVHDAVFPTVIKGLSALLERGINVPDNIYGQLTNVVISLGEFRQNIMSTGEVPISIFSRNLRYYTSLHFIGDLQNTTVLKVPQSALELFTGASVPAVAISGHHSMNGTIKNTVDVAGVSLWEILINTNRGYLNSTSLALQTRDKLQTLDHVVGDWIMVSLDNFIPVQYHEDEIVISSVICPTSSDRLKYAKNVTCGYDLVEVACPGDSSVYMEFTCPYSYQTPQCMSFDSEKDDFAPNIHCTVSSFDEISSVCICDGDGYDMFDSKKRKLESSSQQIYTVGGMRINVSIPLTILETEVIIREHIHHNYIVFITASVYFSLILIGFWIIANAVKSAGGLRTSLFVSEFEMLMRFAYKLLGSEARCGSLASRFVKTLHMKSEYLSIFRWKSELRKAEAVELLEKWLCVGGVFLHLMFVHAILAWTIYSDSDKCDGFDSSSDCRDVKSPLLVDNACSWDHSEFHCKLRSPLTNIIEVFILVAFASLFAIPLNVWWRLSSRSFLRQWVFTKSTQVAVVDSSQCDGDTNSHVNKHENISAAKFAFKSTRVLPTRVLMSIADERDYMLSEAAAFFDQTAMESHLLTERGARRQYLRKELFLKRDGRIGNKDMFWASYGFGWCVQKPLDKLTGYIRRARRTTDEMSTFLNPLSDDELRNIFIIEHLFIHLLPKQIRQCTLDFFFGNDEFARRFSRGSLLLHVAGLTFPLFAIGLMAIVLAFGFQWAGHTPNAAWLSLVAINMALDCVLIVPVRVFFHQITIPALFMHELQRIHSHVYARYSVVVNRMNENIASSVLDLVQHMNPSCRIVRAGEVKTKIAESFLFLSDLDLPLIEEADNDTPSFFLVAFMERVFKLFVFSVYSWLPELLVNPWFEFILTVVVLLVIAAFYALSTVSVYVPVLVSIGILAILTVYAKMRSMGRGHHAKEKATVDALLNNKNNI